jgi:hypothetical protein
MRNWGLSVRQMKLIYAPKRRGEGVLYGRQVLPSNRRIEEVMEREAAESDAGAKYY